MDIVSQATAKTWIYKNNGLTRGIAARGGLHCRSRATLVEVTNILFPRRSLAQSSSKVIRCPLKALSNLLLI